MKLIKLAALTLAFATFATTGCSAFTATNIEKVDCAARYTSNSTWPHRYKIVKIDERRVDRVGNTWVHPVRQLDVHFYNHWIREGVFTDYQCEKVVDTASK